MSRAYQNDKAANKAHSPVITIDGASGTGKGTICQRIAAKLGWYYLDSGALYRAMAWGVLQHQVNLEDEQALTDLLAQLNIELISKTPGQLDQVWCDGVNVTIAIRQDDCSAMASKMAALPCVRAALLARQRAMREPPGLVTDGRDMGTVVFPDAELKFFFTADSKERAKRRFNQLKQQGINVSLREIQGELAARDKRDASRAISPLKPAPDAICIDTTYLTISEVVEHAMDYVHSLYYEMC